MKIYCIALSLILIVAIQHVNSYNILVLTPTGSKSHKIFFMGIVNELLARGHHATIVSGNSNPKPIKNLKDVVVPNEIVDSTFLKDVFTEGSGTVMKNLIFRSPEICVKSLAESKIQDLKKDKYDVVIISLFFNFCYLSLVQEMQIPFIYASPAGLHGVFHEITGQVNLHSVVPNVLFEAKFPMSFTQRLGTFAFNFIFEMFTYQYVYPSMHNLCIEKGLCRPDMPPFTEFDKNVSLTFLNDIQALETPPKPTMQNIVYAGGAHLKPGKPLPRDLETWAQSSGDEGFIYFSLGSAVNPVDMPEKHRLIMLKVFGTLKQKVLWKWNTGIMDNLPSNVRVEKWLPQPDLLAHSKIRMFITHGGLLSTMEATYHGIPLLGMPVFVDQFANLKQASLDGYAKVINWKDLTEERFKKIIEEILNDKTLAVKASERSKLMKDRNIDPAENAAFWVEYVVRNKGAPHLRSPIPQMSWITYNNVDVFAVIFGGLLVLLYAVFQIIKLLCNCCFGKQKKKLRKNKRD